MKYYLSKETLAEVDRTWYEKCLPAGQGFSVPGSLLIREWPECGHVLHESSVIIKGPRTPYGYVRDCGDHYIVAYYSRYDRVDKQSGAITHDVEDM